MENTRENDGVNITKSTRFVNGGPKEIAKAAEELAAQSHETWDKIEVRYTMNPERPDEDIEVRVSKTKKFAWNLFKHFGISITCEKANVYRITE